MFNIHYIFNDRIETLNADSMELLIKMIQSLTSKGAEIVYIRDIFGEKLHLDLT